MNDQLQIFTNEEFGEIRALEINGEPWLIGRDVAIALLYKEPHKAITRHVDEEDRMKYPILTNGGYQDTCLIIAEIKNGRKRFGMVDGVKLAKKLREVDHE